MSIDDSTIWLVIAALAVGSFGLRYSFLGLFAGRDMPGWLLRPLRYAAVAVLPGLVAPIVLVPAAAGGAPDPARIAAALAAFGVGALTRNLVFAMLAGAVMLYGLPVVLGGG